jgi:hypothetical protein
MNHPRGRTPQCSCLSSFLQQQQECLPPQKQWCLSGRWFGGSQRIPEFNDNPKLWNVFYRHMVLDISLSTTWMAMASWHTPGKIVRWRRRSFMHGILNHTHDVCMRIATDSSFSVVYMPWHSGIVWRSTGYKRMWFFSHKKLQLLTHVWCKFCGFIHYYVQYVVSNCGIYYIRVFSFNFVK